MEQDDASSRPEPEERDRRDPGGPASSARPGAAHRGSPAGFSQEASYGHGPGDYRPDDQYQRPSYGQEGSYRRTPAGYGENDPYGPDDYAQNEPGYPQNGSGYGQNDPGYAQDGPGYPQDGPGYPQDGPGYAQNDPGYGPAGYQQDGSHDGGPAGYDQDTRWPGDPAGSGRDGSYQNGYTGYDQDTRHQETWDQDARYQDDRYQGGPGGYDDTRYEAPGYGQGGYGQGGYSQGGYSQGDSYQNDQYQNDQYQGGPGAYGQGPPDGQQPGDDGGPTRHRHNKSGPAVKAHRLHRPRPLRFLRRLLSHRSAQAVLVALVIFLGWVGWSVGHALTVPGNGTVSTRLAEWARDHYLGPVVTLGEWLTYQAPKVGGKPQFSLTAPTTGTGSGASRSGTSAFKPDVPVTLTSPAGAPLAGEGQWRLLASVNGYPAIYGTYLRPDSVHTSYVAGIASMDQRLLKFQLRPGAEDPGGTNWGYSPYLPADQRTGLLATFNGGFKVDAAGGGFYLNGHTKGVLTTGAASLVYYRNGTVAIGSWGQTVSMNASVLGVRQNLKLIVDHGAIPASVDQNVQSQWGATLGGAYYVWRSGIGITRDGRVVWVYGPALSVRTLANLLQHAGAVEGMQMDINPEWMSYMYYKPAPSTADPTPANLLPTQHALANRYYSINSRDFTAVFAR